MSMKYIREHYNVPAKRGMKVNAQGHKGVIVGSKGHYLRIKIHGEKNILLFHPTWEMEYLKGKEKMEEQIEENEIIDFRSMFMYPVEKEEEQTCENCFYHIYKEVCPVPFEVQGQLSSQGSFFCPYWTGKDSLAHMLECFEEKTK